MVTPVIIRRLEHAYQHGQTQLMHNIFDAHKKKCDTPDAWMELRHATYGPTQIIIHES